MNRRADVVKDTRELIVTRLITLTAKIRLELDGYPERWRGSCQVPARIRGITGEQRTEKLENPAGERILGCEILLVSDWGENTHYRAIPSQYGTRYE